MLDAFAVEVRPREGTKTYGEWRTEENSRADGQRKEEKGMRGKDTKRVGGQKRIEEARIAEEERREEMKREEKKMAQKKKKEEILVDEERKAQVHRGVEEEQRVELQKEESIAQDKQIVTEELQVHEERRKEEEVRAHIEQTTSKEDISVGYATGTNETSDEDAFEDLTPTLNKEKKSVKKEKRASNKKANYKNKLNKKRE